MNQSEEQQCIQAVMDGNSAAFAPLVDRYSDLVFTITLRVCGSREEAEEVAQDVFLKAYRGLGSFSGKSRFSTWLYRIAYNQAISATRKKSPPPSSSLEVMHHDPAQRQLDPMEQSDRKTMVRQALDQLRPGESLLLTLFYLEEQSVDEIAQITGLTKGNIKIKLHRARQQMKLALKQLYKDEVADLSKSLL